MKANNTQTQLPLKRFQTWIKSTKLDWKPADEMVENWNTTGTNEKEQKKCTEWAIILNRKYKKNCNRKHIKHLR